MSLINWKCPFHVFTAGALASLVVMYSISLIPFRKRIQRFDVDKRFSNAITCNGMVFISGQVGEGNTIEEQTQTALNAVDTALAQAGTDKSRIVELTIWLKDISSDYAAMNAVYDRWLVPGEPPCRACVHASLYTPSCRVEIRVVAAL